MGFFQRYRWERGDAVVVINFNPHLLEQMES